MNNNNSDMWNKFDETYDLESLKKPEQPDDGIYIVNIQNIELKGTSTTGEPMISIWFYVNEIDEENEHIEKNIFYNQVISESKQLQIALSLIRNIAKPFKIDTTFESYSKLGNDLAMLQELCIDRKYILTISTSNNGYKIFKIKY